jgi:LacI family gluconate utilization system Gnt-I transcriptional repressor
VSKETRAHILRVVKDLNYVPDQMAGSLSSKRSGFVAVLVPSLNNLHFAGTVQALTAELEKHALQILLGHTDYSKKREEQLVETMLRRRPEAVILSYDGHTQRTVDLLSNANIPVVELWERPEAPIDHTIGISNEQAAFAMATALISKGYKRLTFLCEAEDDWTRGASRRRGFIRAMHAAGLPDDRIVRVGKPPISIEDGASALPILRAEYPDTDCVLCVSDQPAFGLLSALRAEGVAVPDEIGIAGFGDFEVSRFSSPTLSTVAISPERIGIAAGELIGRILANPDRAVDQVQINVKAELSFRESTRA